MAIHIGKKIKEEIQKQRVSVTEFAEKINRSRNVVYDIFDRGSIDTSLLNTIGKVLNCDFFSLYSAQKEYAYENMKSFLVNENTIAYANKQSEEIKNLQQQNVALKSEIELQKKIISLLEAKGKSK
jgi:hypothetical protein